MNKALAMLSGIRKCDAVPLRLNIAPCTPKVLSSNREALNPLKHTTLFGSPKTLPTNSRP